jgi:cellobiose phosphorylase
LLAVVRTRFIPGTHLPRYGEGDWNDTLQPADPGLREWLVSSWTAALLFQQIRRYGEVLRRCGRSGAEELAALAAAIRDDFNRHLIRDGAVAGYALFAPDGGAPELLLHPSDTRTGVSYSLIPMTCAIIGGLFTPEQARHHLGLIREHLLFPDGVRLMDKPMAYHGGVERTFRRAESSAYFGREVGLMYVHAHLRYCEAMGVLGETQALRDGLRLVNPIAVTEDVPHAALRQRNVYFTSSDAAFRDRYEAGSRWDDVRMGQVAVEGGWRMYSSGPGLYVHVLLAHVAGIRRYYGERNQAPMVLS